MGRILCEHTSESSVHCDERGDLGQRWYQSKLTIPKTPPALCVPADPVNSPAASSQNVTSRQAKRETRAMDDLSEAMRKINVIRAQEVR